MFRTDDGGANWIGVGPGLPARIRGLFMARDHPETLYAAGPETGVTPGPGVLVTTDLGATWRR